MRRALIVGIAFLAALAFPSGIALASGGAPETAVVLSATNSGDNARLVGDTGGAVRFYRIDYAGNGQPVWIRLNATPSRNVTGPRFGFKVYGPFGLLGEAVVDANDDDANDDSSTQFSFTLAGVTPGSYLVQVYNFTDRIAVDFAVRAEGIPADDGLEGPTQSPSGTKTASGADRAMLVSSPSGIVGGTLVGQDGGIFHYLTVEYPGMNTQMDLRIQYAPPSPLQNGAVGFDVYGSDGTRLCQGTESSRDASSATVSCALRQEVPDTLTVQLLNYHPNLAVNYLLQVTGAAGTLVEATGNDTPERAFVLTADRPAMTGTIAASPDGAFNFFLLDYPGSKLVNVGIVVDERNGYAEAAAGINLYDGSVAAGTATAHLSSTANKRIAYLTIYQESPVTYGIQVFNWTKGMPLPYRIFVTGL